MSKISIAVTDHVFSDLKHAERVLSQLDAEILLAAEPTEEAILEVARQADGLMVTFAEITAGLIGSLERCKSIGRFGIGVNNIDLDAATKAGIQVTYVPDYCVDEVSDHALTLLLSLARKIPQANKLVQSGRWSAADVAPIYRIRGRTLGLAGLGKIPQALVPKAQALGLKVIAADPFVPAEVAASLDVELVDFDALLARSDYISIHAPLTDDTFQMFGKDAFGKMKPEALLINTSRGPLIDEDALAAALDAGEIGGAALDVVIVEPPAADFSLLGRDNVILTPHAAFYSVDALIDLQTKAAEDVVAVLSGETPRYPVNNPDR